MLIDLLASTALLLGALILVIWCFVWGVGVYAEYRHERETLWLARIDRDLGTG